MRKITDGIRIILSMFFYIAFLFLVGIFLSSGFKGDLGNYGASASNEDGKAYVEENEVRYICGHVYHILGANVLLLDCKYAIDVLDEYELTLGGSTHRISYNQLHDSYVPRLGLEPKFSLWQSYGWVVMVIVLLIGVVYWARTL